MIAVDARNHGDSPHTPSMSYPLMAEDLARLVEDLMLETVSLVGHSMGGRTVMFAALNNLIDVEKLVVVIGRRRIARRRICLSYHSL